MRRSVPWVVALLTVAPAVLSAAGGALERQGDVVLLPVGDGTLRIELCTENVVRVAYSRDRAFFTHLSLMAAPRRCGPVPFKVTSEAGDAVLSTARLKLRVDFTTGALAFLDPSGKTLLAERGRTLTPADVQGEHTLHVRQEWEPASDESLYGLGEQQLGLMDLKGYDIDLWQHNGTVAVPFLVSSRGYGVLWDNNSFTRFGDLRPMEALPAPRLFDAEGHPGGLTGSYYAGAHFDRLVAKRVDADIDIAVAGDAKQPNLKIHPSLPPTGDVSVRWDGEVQADETGDHELQTFSNAGIRLYIDETLVIDHWRQGWLPWLDVAKLRFEAGRRYRVRLEWSKDQGMETLQLRWKTPTHNPSTSLWSEVGDGIDYWFVYGPELDDVVAGYRRLTGEAPLPPRWAFGLWQSRQRYKTSQESLDVVAGFRSRGIPLDVIVQDWFYWKEEEWGSHRFDATRFPDPEAWIREIHDKHAKLLISVWPKFYPGTANFEALRSRGFLYEPNLKEGIRDWLGHVDTFYDAFSAAARWLFWSQIEAALFRKGVDAWWMDASEPDLTPTPSLEGQRSHVHPTALGTGARVLNAYPLVNSQGIYEGQRAAAPNQRVAILTRSGFAGQQRYAAATWSGDVSSTWTALRKQITAGLGLSLSGLPYWSMDIGGFSVPARFAAEHPKPEDVEEWRELNTRWFEFGSFVPLLRVHGESPNREMWYFGGESDPAFQAERKFDRLRYRLLPYVYSLAGAVTEHAGTLMRPLVMDFRADARAREVGDQYLFGPALMVSPVTVYKARSRSVYLPEGAGFYDLWTGTFEAGGRSIDAPAPYDALPVHVRAGSILPLGPELQYTDEKAADPVTLVVYAGADATFSLYEDDGVSYAYEKGARTWIPLHWNDQAQTLSLGPREGSFPGMLAERTFEVVVVSRSRPRGIPLAGQGERTIRYDGRGVTLAASSFEPAKGGAE
jgi:alpha-D-xyloside xylohydrolase